MINLEFDTSKMSVLLCAIMHNETAIPVFIGILNSMK